MKDKKTKVGLTTKQKMLSRKEDLLKKSKGGNLIFPKDGITRLRIKSRGDDEELGLEIIQFYLNAELGGIISPATFGEPCPFMDKYEELKNSDDDDDKDLAKMLVPRRKYVIGGIGYKDEKGKEIDPERIDKAFLIPRSAYQDIIDLYLDEDEWGDMSDPIDGYDIKISRSGKGKLDTTYSVSPCQKKPLDKKYRGIIDLESIIKKQIPSYEELEQILNKFLKTGGDEDDDYEKPRPKKKNLKNHKKHTKSNSRDIPF